MFNPSSFYSTLTPMFYTTKVFGLTPFSINRERCKNSNINVLWSISFMTFISAYGFTGIKSSGITYELIATVTWFLDTLIGQGAMCFGILFGCIFRNDIISLLQDIDSFDKNIHANLHIDLKKEYKKTKIYSLIGLLITSFCAIGFVMITTIRIGSTQYFTFELFGGYINYIFPYLIDTFVDLQFCTLVLNLKQRFCWLNTKLIAVFKNLENKLGECDNILAFKTSGVRPTSNIVASGFIQDKALYLVEKIRCYHYQLCEMSNTLNKAYSVQILFVLLQNIITIIVSFYYGGKHIIVDNIIPLDYLLYTGMQLTVAITQLIALVVSCSTTTAEAQKISIIIHQITPLSRKLENRCKEELQLEVSYFSLQLLHQNVKYTACKLFSINAELIFSIIGAITTYIVIVLQFEITNIQHH